MFTTLHLFLIWRIYLSVLVTCYAYIVYNTHITEDSWINTQDSTRPPASERN